MADAIHTGNHAAPHGGVLINYCNGSNKPSNTSVHMKSPLKPCWEHATSSASCTRGQRGTYKILNIYGLSSILTILADNLFNLLQIHEIFAKRTISGVILPCLMFISLNKLIKWWNYMSKTVCWQWKYTSRLETEVVLNFCTRLYIHKISHISTSKCTIRFRNVRVFFSFCIIHRGNIIQNKFIYDCFNTL